LLINKQTNKQTAAETVALPNKAGVRKEGISYAVKLTSTWLKGPSTCYITPKSFLDHPM